ncbi:MAG: hypothetical protein KBI35_07210 [Ruminococcus sp.]|nr:hypothetical protein [Ruminococcus sp.]
MKQYKYIRIKCGAILTQYLTKKDGRSPRDVIDEMGARGYEFKGTVPVYDFGGKVYEYDMVFEIDTDNK